MPVHPILLLFFFFNDTATTEIYTLSLHDALPICFRQLICLGAVYPALVGEKQHPVVGRAHEEEAEDRKSTRLNSSHDQISYAVFCLKKKNHTDTAHDTTSMPTLRVRICASIVTTT